jgi:hypothetical protein
LECVNGVFLNEKDVLKHVKKHRNRFLDNLVNESEDLIEYRSCPFVIKGLTNPRPLIMPKEKTQAERDNESIAAKESVKILQERIRKLEAERWTPNNLDDKIDDCCGDENAEVDVDVHADVDVDDDDDDDDANEENSSSISLNPGDTVFRLERNSSITASGRHVTKFVANPNALGGCVMSNAIIVEATGRHKKTLGKKTIIRNAQKVNDLTTELCRGTPGSKNILLGKVIDKQSPEDVKEIASTNKPYLRQVRLQMKLEQHLQLQQG